MLLRVHAGVRPEALDSADTFIDGSGATGKISGTRNMPPQIQDPFALTNRFSLNSNRADFLACSAVIRLVSKSHLLS